MAERRRRLEGGRRHKYTVRFADGENDRLAVRAGAAGLTVPHMIAATVLLAMDRKDRLSVVDRRMLAAELTRLQREHHVQGVNLNQLARSANTHGQIPDGNHRAMRDHADLVVRLRALLDVLEGLL